MAKSSNNPDPFYRLLDGLFKGLWWLITLPFKGWRGADVTAARAEFQAHWQQIELLVQQENWKEAVMKGDILLNRGLAWAGVGGSTLGERLKAAVKRLSRPVLDAAWRAHKVRNRLAHELHYQLGANEAKEAIRDFKMVLKELGLL